MFILENANKHIFSDNDFFKFFVLYWKTNNFSVLYDPRLNLPTTLTTVSLTQLGVACGNAFNWFKSYLSDWTQRISIEGTLSNHFKLNCGVPQGSCLGPLLFKIYTSNLFQIFERDLPEAHCFADDTQLYLRFKPDSCNSQDEALQAMERCLSDIQQWLIQHRLMINDDKTECLLVGTRQQLNKNKSMLHYCWWHQHQPCFICWKFGIVVRQQVVYVKAYHQSM